MTRYPRQIEREYLPYSSGGLDKIQMIDSGTLDLHQDLVACDGWRRYIVEHQLPTVFQQSDSFHDSSPQFCPIVSARPRFKLAAPWTLNGVSVSRTLDGGSEVRRYAHLLEHDVKRGIAVESPDLAIPHVEEVRARN